MASPPADALPDPDPAAGLRWRTIVDGAGSGAANMAADEALARALPTGSAVLRLYRWSEPTVSLGRNQPARDAFDREAAARRGIPFVRRPTGGRAVLHHREVTYAVVVGAGVLGGLRRTYRRINGALTAGLRELGIDAVPAPEGGEAPTLDARPCFDGAAPGEVMVGGRKLVGSAQGRVGRTVLQHGSILLADDQELLREIAVRPEPTPPPATVSGALGREPPWEEVARALRAGFRDVLPGSWTGGGFTPEEDGLARELERHYASEEWTWRR